LFCSSRSIIGYTSFRLKSDKPNPPVYALGPSASSLPPREICFVSANACDAAGAKASGYTVVWCSRAGAAMDELGFTPDVEIRCLDELPRGPALAPL